MGDGEGGSEPQRVTLGISSEKTKTSWDVGTNCPMIIVMPCCCIHSLLELCALRELYGFIAIIMRLVPWAW